MASPLCQVKDGAGSYQNTDHGVDVTPGNTITIKLLDSSVKNWLIQCITTDELNDREALTASLTIDPLNKTATFVAPAAGSALRFLTMIDAGHGLGIGPNGVPLPAYSKTFGIYTPVSGRSVIAADETTERDPVFGYIATINRLIRNPSPGSGEANTLTNVGASGVDIAEGKSGVDYPIRRIAGVKSTTATLNGHVVEIDADGIDTLITNATGNIDAQTTVDGGGKPRSRIVFTGAAPNLRSLAGGFDKRRSLVLVASGGPLTIEDEYAPATATNRIRTGTGATLTIPDEGAALVDYDANGGRWRVIAGTGVGNTNVDCEDVFRHGAFGNGISDDAPAFRAAQAAAAVAGHNRVCVPPGTYYFGSSYKATRYTAVLVNQPTQFIGRSGARTGPGKVKITVAAGLTGFAAFAGKAAEGGAGADGWTLFGIEMVAAGAAAVVAYAASTPYTVGQLIKPNASLAYPAIDTGGNKHLYEVIRAGTTAAVVETVAIADEPHTPDRCTPWTTATVVGAGAIVRSTSGSGTNWNVFFIAQNGGTTHATTEPTWNFTVGATTNDNGITWECIANPNILVMGTVVCRVVAFDGVISMARCLIEDCRFSDFQNAGVMVEGNASTPIIDADARGSVISRCDFRPPFAGGGNKGIGLYFRGGELKGCQVISCRFDSRVATNQGGVALPTDGSQHQHGLLDNSTFGQLVMGCTFNGGFTGYDIWIAGTSSEGICLASHSDLGRCRFDSSSGGWIQGGKLWGVLGMNQLNSTSTSITKNGLVNAVEISPNGLMYGGLNGGNTGPFNYWKDLVDSGNVGIYPSSGWGYYAWAATTYAAWAISNRQVATHANAPRGREAGELLLPNGADFGSSTDSIGIFSNLAEYIGSQSFNRRGGYRRVGDIIMRPDRAADGAFAADIVVTAGHEGPVWTANTAKVAKVNPGSSSSHVGSVVAPTNPANTKRFVCITAGTTHATTEPAGFATAPTPGVSTVPDGTVTWLYIGNAPVRSTTWFAGESAGGGDWLGISPASTTDDEIIQLQSIDISGYDDGVYTFDFEVRGGCLVDSANISAVIYKIRNTLTVIDGEIVDSAGKVTFDAESISSTIETAIVDIDNTTTATRLQITGADGYLVNWSGKYKVAGTTVGGTGPTSSPPLAPDVVFGANLKRWYKENYTAATGVWVDETGTVNTSQSGAGRRPSSSTINGHVCAQFDGSDDGLVAGTGTAAFSTACTIFGVLKTASLVGTAYLWCKTYAANAYGIGATLGHSHKLDAWINHPSSPGPAQSDALVDDDTPHAFLMRWNGSTVELWIDDVLQATTQAKASPLNTTTDLMSLGSAIFTSDSTHDYHYNGKLGNTGLADRAATDDEIHSLMAYLMDWAGI